MTEDAAPINSTILWHTELDDKIQKAFKDIRNDKDQFEIGDFDFGGDDFGWM